MGEPARRLAGVSPARAPLDLSQLRKCRVAAGLTQQELARRLGIAGGERISAWENGRSVPRPGVLAKAAGVLGVEVVDLLSVERGQESLGELRLCAGLTVRELAARARVGVGTLARWEAGERVAGPDPSALERLARGLGVPTARVSAAVAVSLSRGQET